MRSMGQDQHLGVKGDKVDLQDVIFKAIMDIHAMAGNVRTTSGGEYQKNSDNFFYQTQALWSTVHYMLSPSTKVAASVIIETARQMYYALKEKNGGSVVSYENQDEVTNITYLAAVRIFQVICDDLHKKGYLAEQRKGVVIGKSGLFDAEGDDNEVDADDELNAPGPDDLATPDADATDATDATNAEDDEDEDLDDIEIRDVESGDEGDE